MIAVPPQGGKRSAGAPGMSNRRQRYASRRPMISRPATVSKRETHWVGYKVHLTETCDAGQPDLMTPVMTTPATTPDRVMGPAIEHDLAARDVLPGIHVLDSGYVDADFLVTAQTQHQVDVVGPAFGSYSRQRRDGGRRRFPGLGHRLGRPAGALSSGT